MSKHTILVLGATGTIGSQVVRSLSTRGAHVRAVARTSRKGAALPGVEHCDLTLGDDASVDGALEGVDRAFLLTPFTDNAVALGKHFIDRARAKGVQRIVKLSAMGSDIEPGIQLGRWHREVERHLEASGIGWTILRPNNFMQNFVGYYPPDAEGAIYLPWGDGACSFIDGADVGRVAAAALMEEGHAGKGYTLTGPAAVSIADAAKTIGEVTGRSIRYVDIPEDAARKAMAGYGAPGWMVDAMLELHAIDKAGYAAAVTDDVARVAGTPARSFEAFAREHAAAWKKP